MNTTVIRREDEAAIRQLVQNMQDGQNRKDGELFASAFAQEHDYIAINGMFLPNQRRKDNARIHLRLYDESTSSVAGNYGEVEIRLSVSKIRPLTAQGVAVVHILSEFHLEGQHEKKTKNVITAVMQKREGQWEILAFHNAPVQKREEEETGFVIHIEGVDTRQGGRTMIKDVPLIGVFVDDQEAALDFYTGKLGLEKGQDEAYGPDARWITVSPAGMRMRIVLKKAEKEYEKAMVGNSDGAPVLTLGTDDVRAAYERLGERGVRFLGEPYRYPWGIGALLLDQDGSPILLQQELGEE
ncbi:MAG TPA: SgcJ/EcaC family oxidoreductase [Rubrobacter sp.]|jgi:uncharacterized protein (TIGR02246 family)|nr:SgcJ/EcaC family oxidoreductase [Rubrobacter sp.]